MIARVVGLLTVVAALFGWMSGFQSSVNLSRLSIEATHDEARHANSRSLRAGMESETGSRRNDIFPDSWRTPNETRTWNYIVLHHSASEFEDVESIHEKHLERKDRDGNSWLGIGYHFVIGNGQGMGDGEVEPTFRWREQLPGAHAGNEEYNQHGIGVVLVGDFEQSSPSSAQLESVKRLVGFLKREHKMTADGIVGHREIKATACPGSLFPLAEIATTEIE